MPLFSLFFAGDYQRHAENSRRIPGAPRPSTRKKQRENSGDKGTNSKNQRIPAYGRYRYQHYNHLIANLYTA
jgi:hypothetical protein